MKSVRAVSPPAAYLGGKRALAAQITKLIHTIEHDGYAEPFVGMGGVFLRREICPSCEYINDINGEVSNLFRVLREHYPELKRMFEFQIASRQEYERLRKIPVDQLAIQLTDVQRAARFLYLQKLSFGGKAFGQVFGVDKTGPSRFNPKRLDGVLSDLNNRLTSVVIENLDWCDFIDRYDRPGMLFYLDPPYWGGENDYGRGVFSRADFKRIAEKLEAIEGMFVLSINDVPEIREVFSGFELEPVTLRYSISGGVGTSAKELIITSNNLVRKADDLLSEL